MTFLRTILLALGISLAAHAMPASAQWRLVDDGEARKVARSELVVTPSEEWNRATQRPTKRSEVWTKDGQKLNDLGFYMAIRKGEPLFKETNKKRNPLPKFDPAMLPTDVVEWFEDTANIVLGGSLFAIGEVRPATLAGYPGGHFEYSYTAGDNLERKGEVRFAVIDERLYMITFDAPALHYFEHDIAEVRRMMDSARFAE